MQVRPWFSAVLYHNRKRSTCDGMQEATAVRPAARPTASVLSSRQIFGSADAKRLYQVLWI